MSDFSPKAVTTYRHVQQVPAETWTIEHWQGIYPAVDIISEVNGQQVKLMPQTITYVDANTVTVNFSTARSGIAVIS